MCNKDLCNDLEYDLHSERAKRLFNNRQQQILLNSNNGAFLTYLNESDSFSRDDDGTVVLTKTIGGAFKDKDERSDENDEGTIYYDDTREEEEENLLVRIPRQINSGRNRIIY